MTRIAVLGAGPHGREIAAVFAASDGYESRLFDDHLPGLEPLDVGATAAEWVIGAAWPEVRRDVALRFDPQFGGPVGYQPPWNAGRFLAPGCHVAHEVETGPHVYIGPNATVTHGCYLDAFVTVAAGATLGGEARVGPGAFIGAGAVVIHGGVMIGAGAFIGAGSVVLDGVPAGEVWAGNPARRIAREWTAAEMAAGRRRLTLGSPASNPPAGYSPPPPPAKRQRAARLRD